MKTVISIFALLMCAQTVFADDWRGYNRLPLYDDLHAVRYVAYKDFIEDLSGNVDIDLALYETRGGEAAKQASRLIDDGCWGFCGDDTPNTGEIYSERYVGKFTNYYFRDWLLDSRVPAKLYKAVKGLDDGEWRMINFSYTDESEGSENGVMIFSKEGSYVVKFSVIDHN